MTRKARLALADGTVYEGRALVLQSDAVGEVVFNTSMTGYEEILTDPSYAGQIVTMTYPEIGNYGLNSLDAQASASRSRSGSSSRTRCDDPSNWRSHEALDAWLAERGLVGLAGIDTRALTRKLRSQGALMGVLSTDGASAAALIERAKSAAGMEGLDLATAASTKTAFDWTEGTPRVLPDDQVPPPKPRHRVTVVDFGVKRGILRQLVDAGCAVRVVPCPPPRPRFCASKPDGVVLSNGPGDPAAVPGATASSCRASRARCRCSASASATR